MGLQITSGEVVMTTRWQVWQVWFIWANHFVRAVLYTNRLKENNVKYCYFSTFSIKIIAL